ncbi:MAG: HNH endonuclease [Desulfobulbaceae bacterium]|nr:HNH endonuclease [Desulfobulbaceae bacterium]
MTANGSLHDNFIEPSFELAATYNRYWQTIAPPDLDSELATTFLDLEDDGFWATTSQEVDPSQPITTMRNLQKSYIGAKIDADIFPLLSIGYSRKKLREALISTYFTPDIRPALLDVALINHGAAIYSKELLSGAPVPSIKTGRGAEINERISELGFNSALVELYDHRCAICGIKLMTPEGHSAVNATHIIPRHISRDDHPSNGLALCKICGWSFDNGLLGIGKKNEVIIPTAIRLNGNLPGHLLIFKDRVIAKTKQESFRPSQENLRWHREKILRN